MHYQRMRTHGFLEKPSEKFTCLQCGVEKVQDKRGPKPMYCSKECGYRHYYARNREEMNAKRRAKTASKPNYVHSCAECGGSFESRHRVKKFCSKTCYNTWRDNHSEVKCSEPDCDRGIRARGVCNMHYRRILRAEGKYQAEPWDDRRRANYHKRRALKRELPADNIRPLEVYERDEWTCGICDEPVPRDSKYPDPLSPSIDHVLPLSKGGHHVMENVQLAHLECNVQKGNRIEADEMSV